MILLNDTDGYKYNKNEEDDTGVGGLDGAAVGVFRRKKQRNH